MKQDQSPAGTRSERIEARTTPDVLKLVRRAAEMQGRSLSEFVVSAAEEAARRAIAETQLVRLSAEDQTAFVEMLMNPPAQTPAMARAVERHRRLVEDG